MTFSLGMEGEGLGDRDSAWSRRNNPSEEVMNKRGDLPRVRLQREVPGVEQADDGVWIVPPVRFGPGRQEERVVPPPRRQQRRPGFSKVRLEPRVQRHVCRVVAEQI